MANRIEISAKTYPVNLVTVFSDRAEITRSISGINLSAGQTEIVVNDLPANLDSDSIRVETTANVIIQDVMQKHRYVPKAEDTVQQLSQPRRTQITSEVKSLESSRSRLRLELERIKESELLFNSYAKKFKEVYSQNNKERSSVDPMKLTEAFRLFKEAQITKSKSSYEKQRLLGKSLKDIEEDIERLNKELSESGFTRRADTVERKEVTIVVYTDAETTFGVDLSYVVSGASWTPKYDLRVDSESGKLFVFYQAEIKQNTNENWESVRLILSTAQPALGGDHPVLDIWKVHFEAPPRPPPCRTSIAPLPPPSAGRGRGRARGGAPPPPPQSELEPVMFMSMRLSAPISTVERVVESAAAVETSAGMAFEIISKSSIPCDNAPHKVNVTFVELKPKFKIVACPSKSPHSFFKAVIKNESEYAFLAGDANVFLDNSFIAKSSLKNVSPQEEFETSLGVDPAVRITYHPRIRKQQTQGVFAKSNVIRFEQRITIHNTRSHQVIAQIFDQLPLSEDEKLKIIMLDPIGIANTPANPQAPAIVGSIRKGKGPGKVDNMSITGVDYPRLNDKMVLEWMLVLDAGKQVSVKFAFEVVYPQEQSISGL